MRRLMWALLAAALVFGSFQMSAWAASATKQVEELSIKAATAYGEGDYDKAIDLFKQAYALQPVPNLLFNIAKVYEKTQNWDEAENNYKEFIKSPDADAKAREVALERIDAIKAIKAANKEAEKPVDPVDKPEDKPAVVAPPPKKASLVPWIVLGSGVAVAGTGAVFGILALGKQTKFEEATNADDKRDLRSSGKTFALLADIGYGVGAAAGIVGIIMLATSGGSDRAQAQAWAPTGWVGPHGEAGMGLHLTF